MFISWLIKLFSKIFFFTGMIGSKNAFAKPLSGKEEEELFEKYHNGDKNAEELLIKHNLRLVAFIAKKYKNYNEQEELISVGSIGLLKAVKTYKPSTGNSFSTYASRCIENEILMLFRNQKKYNNEISLEENIGTDKEGNTISLIEILSDEGEDNVAHVVEQNIIIDEVVKIINEKLEAREREVIARRYGLFGFVPQTQKEVATLFGISRSYISRIEKDALNRIKEEFNSLNTKKLCVEPNENGKTLD